MRKRIALLYDFDYTLANGFMQQFGLMQDHGYNDVIEYFKACEDVFEDKKDIDMCLSLMGGILKLSWEKEEELLENIFSRLAKMLNIMKVLMSGLIRSMHMDKKRGM